MSIYAVGDIHGQLGKLNALLDKLPIKPDDELVFLGDYVDRGPDSKGVIDRLLAFSQTNKCQFLLGNHDDVFLDYMQGCKTYDRDDFPEMKGYETLESYGVEIPPKPGPIAEVPASHVEFLANLKVEYKSSGYLFVHAGRPNDDTPFEHIHTMDKLWIQSSFYKNRLPWPEGFYVFGHRPFKEPVVTECAIGIDTNAAYEGPLTAVKLPDVEFFHS